MGPKMKDKIYLYQMWSINGEMRRYCNSRKVYVRNLVPVVDGLWFGYFRLKGRSLRQRPLRIPRGPLITPVLCDV